MNKLSFSANIASIIFFSFLGFLFSVPTAHAKFIEVTRPIEYKVIDPPEVIAQDKTITLPTTSVSAIADASDYLGTVDILTFRFVTGPTPDAVVSNIKINPSLPKNKTRITAELSNMTKIGDYTFEIVATDNDGEVGSDVLIVTVKDKKIPPVANAGEDRTVKVPASTVTISGATATDTAPGKVVGTVWTKVSGGAGGTITSGTSLTPTFSGLTFAGSPYTFRLTVTDDDDLTATDDMEVKVCCAPIVSLTANPTTGAPGTKPTLIWTVKNNPKTCTASGKWNGPRNPDPKGIPEPQARLNFVGAYDYTLTCSNDAGDGSDTKTVTIDKGGGGGGGNLPDLITSTLPASTVAINKPTDYSAEVTNIGNASTIPPKSKGTRIPNMFQYDDDIDHSPGKFLSVVASSISPLDVGEKDTTSIIKSFPKIGTWYIRFCADMDSNNKSTISESNEKNNCGVSWTEVEVVDAQNAPACGDLVGPCVNSSLKGEVKSDKSDPKGTPYKYIWNCTNVPKMCTFPYPQCSDGYDNDGDGDIDYNKEKGKGDKGCISASDTSESDIKIKVIEQ